MRLKFVSKTGLIIANTHLFIFSLILFVPIVSSQRRRFKRGGDGSCRGTYRGTYRGSDRGSYRGLGRRNIRSYPSEFEPKLNETLTPNPIKMLTFSQQPHVVVIGAGASGIAAATELIKYGIKNVTILEAENRIGGRIYTEQLFNEKLVDLGAEFYEGFENDAVWNLTKPYHKILINKTSEKFKLYRAQGDVVDENMRLCLFKFLNEFQESEDCANFKSVGECFEIKYEALINSSTPEYADFLKRSRTWARTMLHLFSMSPDLYDWGLGTHPDKGPLWSWARHGYGVVLNLMLGRWPDPLKQIMSDDQILLNKEVVKIENWRFEDRKVIIKCADKSKYIADHVICTVSLGVLKATHNQLFEPVLLPEKREAIEKTGFGPLLKIIIRFKQPVQLNDSMGVVWEDDEFIEPIQGKNLFWLEWLSFMIRAENNKKALICFFTGMGVNVIESLSEEVIMAGLRYLTFKVLKPQSIVTDFPDQFVRTSWCSNRHFMGVNSYKTIWGDFQKQLAAPMPSEEDPKILFAGEATHPRYYTTVHGAVESGLREAWRLIDRYKIVTDDIPF